MSDPAPPPAPPPSRRGRRALVALGIAGGLLGLGALLLPVLLSSSWGRSLAERKGSEASSRSLSLGGLSVGWGDTELRDLVLRTGPAASDPVLLKAERVTASAGIAAACSSRYDLGTIRILKPELRIDQRAKPGEKTGVRPAGGGNGSPGEVKTGEPAAVPGFSVKVEVREGTLLRVDGEGRESRLGSFRADVTASDAGPATLELDLDLGPAGRAKVKASLDVFDGGKVRAPAAFVGTLEATLEALDLAILRETAGAAAGLGLEKAAGTVTGAAVVRVEDGCVDVEKADLRFAGLSLAGPALGPGIRVEEKEIRVAGGFRCGKDGALEIREGALEAPGLSARASLTLPAKGPVVGSGSVRGEVRPLLPRFRALGLEPSGDAVGDFVVEGSAAADASGQRTTLSVDVSDLMAAPGRGRPPLEEPSILLRLDLVRTADAWRVDTGTLRSGSATLDVTGSFSEDAPCDLRLQGKARMARVAAFASLLGLEPPGTVGGTASLDARWVRAGTGAPGPGDGASGTLLVEDLLLAPPGGKGREVREPRLEVSFRATPGKEGLDVPELRVHGAGADLRAAGHADRAAFTRLDLSSVEGSLDLARATAVAETFRAIPARLEGTATWKGPLALVRSSGLLSLGAGEFAIRGLVATIPGKEGAPPLVVREDEVRIAVDGDVASAKKGVAATLRRLALSARGIEIDVTGAVAADGRLDLRCAGTLGLADLARRALELGFLERDFAPRGSLALDLGVRGEPGSPEIVVNRCATEGAEFDLGVTGNLGADGSVDLAAEGRGGLAPILGLLARAGYGDSGAEVGGSVSLRLRAAAPDGNAPLRISSEWTVRDLLHPDPAGRKPWTQTSVVASVDGSLDRASRAVQGSVEVRADDGRLSVKGTAVLAAAGRSLDADADVDFDFSGFTRSRPSFLPLEKLVVGRVKGKAKASGPLDPARLRGSASLAVASVRTEPFEMKDATVEAAMDQGVLVVPAIVATVNGGTVKGSATFGLAGASPAHFVEVHADGVQVDRALGWFLRHEVPLFAVADSGGVSGVLHLDLRLDGTGPDWEGVKPNLHGRGSLRIDEGSISGSGTVAEVLEILGGEKGLDFHSLATTFQVHDGRVWNDRLFVNGKDKSMTLRGSTTFDGKLDYKIGAKRAKMGSKKAERLKPLLDEDGNLPFTLGGTLSKPKVKPPDLKSLLGNGAEDALRKKLKDLLGGGDD